MADSLHMQDKLVVGIPGVTRQPWLPAFDQHVPARVVSAMSFENDFVVLSGEDGISGEVASAVIDRLREAGFEVAGVTAPLPDLSLLHDAIRDGLLARRVSEKPLVVVIAGAEKLSAQTVHRLVTLAELRQDERPVLRFLLTGTPALWPILRTAGLGSLKSDAAAHVRVMSDLIRSLTDLSRMNAEHPHEPDRSLEPPVFGLAMADPSRRRQGFPLPQAGSGLPRPDSLPLRLGDSQAGHRAAVVTVGLVLAGLGLAGGVAAWGLLAPRPDRPAAPVVATVPPVTAPVMSPDERLALLLERENKEIAAGDPISSGDLVETRRQIDEILPQVSIRTLSALAARDEKSAAKPVAVGAAPGSAAPAPAMPAPWTGQVTRAVPPPVASRGSPAPDKPRVVASGPDAPSSAGAPVDAPTELPLHVTLRYSRGDNAAAARAMRVRTSLLARGVPVDGPVALGQVVKQSSLAYYFPQDQTAALDLAQHMLPILPQVHRLPPPSEVSLPRPGEISISIGSGIPSSGNAAETTRSSGKRT